MPQSIDRDADDFFADCEAVLGFVRTRGFARRENAVDFNGQLLTTAFLGKRYAIEMIWDRRDDVLELKVAEMEGGTRPQTFAVAPDGRVVRRHLTDLLIRRGVRGFDFSRGGPDETPQQRRRRTLEDYARLLEGPGQAVLSEDPGLLTGGGG